MKTMFLIFLTLFLFLGILSSHPSKQKNNLIQNSIDMSSLRIELEDPTQIVNGQLLIYPQYIEPTSFIDGSPCLHFRFWGNLYLYNAIGAEYPFLINETTAYLFSTPSFPSILFKTDGTRFKILTGDADDTTITHEGKLSYGGQSRFDYDISYTLSYYQEITDTMLIIKNIKYNLRSVIYGDTAILTSYPNREFILLKLDP